MRSRIDSGKWQWKACTGYLNGPKGTKGAPSLVIDPARGHLLRKAFELVAAGATKAAALKQVTALGLRPMRGGRAVSQETFDGLLKNPLFKGEVFVKGWAKCVKGDFEPIVSPELFDRVQSCAIWPSACIRPTQA